MAFKWVRCSCLIVAYALLFLANSWAQQVPLENLWRAGNQELSWSNAFSGTLPVDGVVNGLTFDATGQLLVHGSFVHAGGLLSHGFAARANGSWIPMGDSTYDVDAFLVDGQVRYLAGTDNSAHAHRSIVQISIEDSLFIIGEFEHGCCSSERIYDLEMDEIGRLYVGGNFETVNGREIENIAVWDGDSWSAMGDFEGLHIVDHQLDEVLDIAVLDSFVYVAGAFTSIDGLIVNHVALWDGQSWNTLGEGIEDEGSRVTALAVRSDGYLFAAAYLFDPDSGATISRISGWDGNSWEVLGEANGYVNKLIFQEGVLYAAGSFSYVDGVFYGGIAAWDGEVWTGIGAGMDAVNDLLVLTDGVIYAGGRFSEAGGKPAKNIARWNGFAWEAIGLESNKGMNDAVYSFAAGSDKLYVGGSFASANSVQMRRIGYWDGLVWHSMGSGVNGIVRAIAVLPDESVVIAGDFTEADGQSASRIAHWNGIKWQPMADGFNDQVNSLAVDAEGQIYAGGSFKQANGNNYLSRWSGSDWEPVGGGVDGRVTSLGISDNGLLYIGGYFETVGDSAISGVAQWDGTHWHSLGKGLKSESTFPASVRDLYVQGNTVWVVGGFSRAGDVSANEIAFWDGENWGSPDSTLHAGLVKVTGDKNGSIYVAGFFYDISPFLQFLARWDDKGWSALNGGLNRQPITLFAKDNTLFVGGSFTQAGQMSSNYIAAWGDPSVVTTIAQESADSEALNVFPNPFSHQTQIDILLAQPGLISVELYDVLGRRVRTVLNRTLPAGRYREVLDADQLFSGIYFLRLVTSDAVYTKAIHLIP